MKTKRKIKDTYNNRSGYLLGFGMDCQVIDGFVLPYTVGIIEWEDGTLQLLTIGTFQFVEEPRKTATQKIY
jgi:hypothetical protein